MVSVGDAMLLRLLLGSSLIASSFAQPLIYNRAIVNAASFIPPRLPGGAIAQGSIFTIFGKRLGPSQPIQVSVFPLGATLAGVSIAVTQGSNTVNAIPLYVSSGQINAIMPSNAPLGPVSLRVTNNALKSNPMTAIVSANALGVFTARGVGYGPGILFNYVSASVQPVNSPTIPATPGQVITLFGTGLGPVPADNVAPAAVSLPTKVELFVGGIPASVQYSGRTPCCAGVDQIVFQVPANATSGCWVPVTIRTGGATVANIVTMAITPDGSSCFGSMLALPFIRGGTYGALLALRTMTHEDIGTQAPIDITSDYEAGYAIQVQDSPFPFHPLLSLPPAGTCTAYSVKGDLLRGDTLPLFVPKGTVEPLASVFNFMGPRGLKMLQGMFTTSPLNYLGGALPGNLIPDTTYLEPGAYQVMGTGTGNIGPFSLSLNLPAPLTWTNRDQIGVVDRTQPLAISWSGGAPDQTVAVVGFSVDLPTDSTSVFGCLAPSGATSFTVPPIFLANLPPTRANPLQSKSVIYLASYPDSGIAKLAATGLDLSYAAFAYIHGKTVLFQ